MKARTRFGRISFHLFILGLSFFFIIYVVLRAVRVPFTPDEAGTFRKFVSTNIPAVFSFVSANNHFLNTLLTKVFYALAGPSKLALRLPNLLAYVIYLVFAFLLLQRFVKTRILVVCGFLLLNLNPYVLDFFSLSRGYGLSLGFLMAGLYFFLSFLGETATPEPRGLRDLYLSLAAVSLAVLSNFVLLNVYLSLVFFSFMAFVVLNSRERIGWSTPRPVSGKRPGRRILLALFILASVLFNLLVMSRDLGLSGRFFEPVSVRIVGLGDEDRPNMQVLRIDTQNLEGELGRAVDLWKTEGPLYFKAIKFRCPPGLLSKIKRIEIRIGPRKFSYDAVDIKRFHVFYVEGHAVFTAKKAVSLRRSIIPTFTFMINWRGDSIFLKALLWRILLITGVAGLAIALIYAFGGLLGRRQILAAEQFRPLALMTILLGSFIGYPLAILSFSAALFVHYKKGAGTRLLPGFSVLSLLIFVFVLTIAERFLFGNPYLFGRTALFLIPLFTLLLVFLGQSVGRLARGLRFIATALPVMMTVLAAYHFIQTANTAVTVDWEREAVILGRLNPTATNRFLTLPLIMII